MELKLETRDLNLWYGDFHALKAVNLTVRANAITAIIGPSGCGKSSLLRVFNRMNELIPKTRVSGDVLLDGQSIFARRTDLSALRKRVGMVFQRPNPFPLSVFENVAYGPKIHGLAARNELTARVEFSAERGGLRESVAHNGLSARVEASLRQTGLWDGLKDRLSASALSLPPEQQQRLCISRLLAVEPEVLLMDEPCSALDPISTARIEELFVELKSKYTIVIVTHNMQQAARISDQTAYMLLGDLVEYGETQAVFTSPSDQRTEEYISGRYG